METHDADFARLKELGKAAIDHAAVIAGLRQNPVLSARRSERPERQL